MRIQLILDRSDLTATHLNKGIDYIQLGDFRYPILEMAYRAEFVKFVDTTDEYRILKDKRG